MSEGEQARKLEIIYNIVYIYIVRRRTSWGGSGLRVWSEGGLGRGLMDPKPKQYWCPYYHTMHMISQKGESVRRPMISIGSE